MVVVAGFLFATIYIDDYSKTIPEWDGRSSGNYIITGIYFKDHIKTEHGNLNITKLDNIAYKECSHSEGDLVKYVVYIPELQKKKLYNFSSINIVPVRDAYLKRELC